MQTKILYLSIRNLFGCINYSIPFGNDDILIITAPNGYGKTIALKIVDAIFNEDFDFISKLDFEVIVLRLNVGKITIEKDDSNDDIEVNFTGKNNLKESFSPTNYFSYKPGKDISFFIQKRLPHLKRISARMWYDTLDEEHLTLKDVLDRYKFPHDIKTNKNPSWFEVLKNSFKVHLIKEQRLIHRDNINKRNLRANSFSENTNPIDVILTYSNDMVSIIRNANLESAQISQKLDAKFPEKLLSLHTPINIRTIDELISALEDLQRKIKFLSSLDLLPNNFSLPSLNHLHNISTSDRKVLSLYIDDTKRKFEPLEALASKINLFMEIINNKGLAYKKLKISRDRGFYLSPLNKREDVLNLTDLSSGEQHQIVLLYDLIFKTEKGDLVLIDEPEISLHVAWQKEFLTDIKDIIRIKKIKVVIATHSPQIINGCWDLVVELKKGG